MKYGFKDYRTAITPKNRLGFRVSTQLDPLDSIIYTAVIYAIQDLIEESRIPVSLNKVFSFRLKPMTDMALYMILIIIGQLII